MHEDDEAPPRGLVYGKCPMLTAFLRRRDVDLERLHRLQARLFVDVVPAEIVAEYNMLSGILSGRVARS